MRRLLLTVKQTFFLRHRNLLGLHPSLVDFRDLRDLRTSRPLKDPQGEWHPDYPRMPFPRPTEVELRLPDGAVRMVPCRFMDTHVNYGPFNWESDTLPGFKPPWVVACGLLAVSAEEVPPGTEVWYDSQADTE